LASARHNGQNEAIIWAALIVILAALCAFSWTFCMYVFGRPEKAFNYNLLIDLEKLPPAKDYQPGNAPRGKFHTPRDLYRLLQQQSEGLACSQRRCCAASMLRISMEWNGSPTCGAIT